MFILHPRLESDTAEIVKLKLCRVLLMCDSRFPWLILVPERPGISEIHGLLKEDRAELIEEITLASRVIEKTYKPDKINIGALGNVVPQFHVHVIGRFFNDSAWPGPVWGTPGGQPYAEGELKETLTRLSGAFV